MLGLKAPFDINFLINIYRNNYMYIFKKLVFFSNLYKLLLGLIILIIYV